MFLPTVHCTDNELMDNALPHLRRGQWLQIREGVKGQYIGHTGRTVWILWHQGHAPAKRNKHLGDMAASFDLQMERQRYER